jgi:hypothetical protein
MDSCPSCNWSGPAGRATCPRCGQPLHAAPDMAPTLVQTSSSSARPVLLLKLLGGELPPEEWEIEGVPVGIGRLDDSDITLPHRSVSRNHARIVPSGNGYEVEDLGSTNGTWLNDKPLTDRVALSDGDSLMVGDIPLVVELIQPQRQPHPEIYEVPQLPAASAGPARAPQAPEGGASTVFFELDDALAAAGPAEPPPPLQPAPPPQPTPPRADYQRAQPATPPDDFQPTMTPPPPAQLPPAPPLPAQPAPEIQRAQPAQPVQPTADFQSTQAAAPPDDFQKTMTPQPAQPPADYQRAQPAPPPAKLPDPVPLQPAKPPAGYQRNQPAARPADYPDPVPLQPAQPPAGYRRTPPQAPPPPPEPEVEVPRAWDDTPPTRPDLPRPSDFADKDEHPTLIGEMPSAQRQAPSTTAPVASSPPSSSTAAWPAVVQSAPVTASPQPAQREPWPAAGQPSPREPWPTSPQTSPYVPAPPGPPAQPYAPAARSAQPAPSAPPASGAPELSAAGMIELAEQLATSLRLLKGDISLAMWLFEHAGGPAAAQEFVDYARRLQTDPRNPQDQIDVLESAAGAARLLEAAILLFNVVSSLDPPGGVDNQLEADAADLQPVARS